MRCIAIAFGPEIHGSTLRAAVQHSSFSIQHFLRSLLFQTDSHYIASSNRRKMSAAPTNQSSPALFFDTVNAFQRSAAIRAAVDLDLFSIIAEGKRTAGDIARRANAAERGVRIVCDYLVVNGFLTKEAN